MHKHVDMAVYYFGRYIRVVCMKFLSPLCMLKIEV